MIELSPINWDDKPGLLESARRYKRLVAALFVVGALLGFGLSLLQPTMYQGVSRVLLNAPAGTNEPNRFLLNQTELIGSVTVTDRAARLVGNRVSGETVRKRLNVDTTIDRDLVTIRVLDPTARGASQLADAVARAYSQILNQQAQATAAELQLAEQRLRRNIDRLDQQLATRPGDQVLTAERTALFTQLQELATRRLQLNSGNDPASGGVAFSENVGIPKEPEQPQTARNIAVGALLGLLLALGLAWWLNGRSETRVVDTEEVQRLLGLPLLARLPVSPRKRGDRQRPIMLDNPETVEAEAFRFLRTSFSAGVRASGARVVMVTSATEEEGKSVVIANLALALARAGQKVGLVDLDLRRPAQRRLLELPESPGFTEVALGRAILERTLHRLVLVGSEAVARTAGKSGNGQRQEVGYVDVLTAGSRPRGVGELVGNRATEEVITRLLERLDIVLVDAPPMLRVGDALSLLSTVDALLVVTRLHAVRRKALGELRRLLDSTQTTQLGVVVNGVAVDDTWTRPYGQPAAATTRPAPAATVGTNAAKEAVPSGVGKDAASDRPKPKRET